MAVSLLAVFSMLERWQKFICFVNSGKVFLFGYLCLNAQGWGEDYLEAIKSHLEALHYFPPLLSNDMTVIKIIFLNMFFFYWNFTLL